MRLDEQTRPDFPILDRVVGGRPVVYLDSAASSQKPRAVIEAMARYYERSHANLHRSIHTLGEEATELFTELEPHSNIVPWPIAARARGTAIHAVPVIGEGVLDLDALDRLLTDRTRVVALAHVSSVLGTANPVREICRRARGARAVTVVDGAQAAPHMPLDISALDCDFYIFSAHEMLGPTGIGVLWGRREALERLEPTRGAAR